VADKPPSESAQWSRILREAAALRPRRHLGHRGGGNGVFHRLEEGPSRDGPIRLEGLTVRYGRSIACSDVSLAAPAGAVYALLGRNGAGKSSLVRCLLGRQRLSGGRALIFGGDSWTTRRSAMARMGVVPEEPDAPPALTAQQISDFCRRVYSRWDAAAVARRLQRFGAKRAVQPARRGEGRGYWPSRSALPELLVLDDPTLGLDVVAPGLFDEIVGGRRPGTTIFLITASPASEASRLASASSKAAPLDERRGAESAFPPDRLPV
jgi:ABC-type Na+ transport system ATPase subunit NatA